MRSLRTNHTRKLPNSPARSASHPSDHDPDIPSGGISPTGGPALHITVVAGDFTTGSGMIGPMAVRAARCGGGMLAGVTLHVHAFGPADGSPILALHGVSGYGGRFADLAERLGRYRILAPDLRGHGSSPALPPWDLRQHEDDLLQVLGEYGLDGEPRVAVVGHSLGGVLAVRLAHRAPQLFSRLVLLDPGTLSSKQPQLALANAERMRIDVSYLNLMEARADRVRNGWQDVANYLVDRDIAQHLEQSEDGRWRWRYCRSALIAVMGDLARPVPAPPADLPTLLVTGANSSAVTPEYRDACRAALGNALRSVELDCGHSVYYERPVETAEHIAAFLGS